MELELRNQPEDVAEDFEILRPQGRGGFAETYLAEERATGQKYVLKKVKLQKGFDPKMLELFEREAEVLAGLEHPGIPRFKASYETATEEGYQLFLVQEFIEGRNLEQEVRSGHHFTEPEAIELAISVAKILEYLHGHDPWLIHRDIKPSNIMRTARNEVYLIDFGAVRDKVLQDQYSFGGGSTFVGTYGYIPYEQYCGRALPASDIFALGMTLIYILSGKEPSDLREHRMRFLFREHVRISEGMARLLEKCIEPDWRDRHASASELRLAFEQVRDAPEPDLAVKEAPEQFKNEEATGETADEESVPDLLEKQRSRPGWRSLFHRADLSWQAMFEIALERGSGVLDHAVKSLEPARPYIIAAALAGLGLLFLFMLIFAAVA